jgi:hypothetical protein
MEKFGLIQPSGFQTMTGQKTLGQRAASNIDKKNNDNIENNNLSSLSSCSLCSICSIVLLYFIFKGMGI